MPAYHLVHIITSGEYKTPLIASQVFDRAQAEAVIEGPLKPASVSVWVIAPMRDVFDKESQAIINELKQRCPAVTIKLTGGVSRLKNWPLLPALKKLRRALGGRVVYHCRGESSVDWAVKVKHAFKHDAVVFDARGYWPLERLIIDGLTEEHSMNPTQKAVFYNDLERLRHAITASDWVCTVSEPLRQMLIHNTGARPDTVLVPCCVTGVIPPANRDKIRKDLDIEHKTAILYLGGTQVYQYLDTLVIPFIRSALSQSDQYVGIFITQNKEKMQSHLDKFGIDPARTRLISVPQHKVADYLTAMDIGLLLKGPTEVNKTSQPVKFGEYLSAGIPVVIEEGTGDLAAVLHEKNIGCVVKLTGKPAGQAFDAEVAKALHWYAANERHVKANARKFVEESYTWQANMLREREMYNLALERVKNGK